LTNKSAAKITFWCKWDIEADYDFTQFQVSTDNGQTWIAQCGNYTVLGTSGNGSVQPANKPLWEGVQSDWVLEEINLSDYLGQIIKVRFQLRADGATRKDGFYFDDFTISANEIDTSSVQLLPKNPLLIIPNPSNGKFTVQGLTATSVYQIEDSKGKKIQEGSLHGINASFELNEKPGVYFFRTMINGQQMRVKIIVVD